MRRFKCIKNMNNIQDDLANGGSMSMRWFTEGKKYYLLYSDSKRYQFITDDMRIVAIFEKAIDVYFREIDETDLDFKVL